MEPKSIKHEPMHVYSLDDKMFMQDLTTSQKKHLLSSMASLRNGTPPTPSFSLYGKSDWSVVEDFFYHYLPERGIKVPEWQLEYEMSRKTKFGPQGGHPAWKELEENFKLYFERPAHVDYTARTPLIEKYGSLRLKLPRLRDVLPSLIKADKIQERAAGWPDFNLKKTNKRAQLNALELAAAAQKCLLTGYETALWLERVLAYVFSRFNKNKKRIFFPAPFFFMLLEAQFFFGFLHAIQEDLRREGPNSKFTFWADKIGFKKMFEQIVTPLAKSYDPDHLVFVQRDFEKMDTTMGEEQTLRSYNPRICAAYGYSEDSNYGSYLNDLARIGGNMAIATPAGIYTGYHGKASGLETTNGDETCSNEDFDWEFQRRLQIACDEAGIRYKVVYTGGNGDDGMTIYYLEDMSKLDMFKKLLAKVADEAAREYGFRVQGSKWFISTVYGLYCQRMIVSKDGCIVDMYPAALILNSIMNPEPHYNKKDWDTDYFDLAIIQKLDNGVNLPYYHELIDYVDKGMKHGLLPKKYASIILSKWDKYKVLRERPFNVEDEDAVNDIFKSPTLRYLAAKRGLSLSSLQN